MANHPHTATIMTQRPTVLKMIILSSNVLTQTFKLDAFCGFN